MKRSFDSLITLESGLKKEQVRSARRGLFVYSSILIPVSILGYLLVIKSPSFILFLMWTPGLSSIITRLVLREGIRDISLRIFGRYTLKSLPFVLLFPVAIGLVAYGIAWGLGLVQFGYT